ncbi:hypothetical protein ABZ760_03290 [Streptomyces sp. NPDC006658]|uniref:hypothetical protein n=1 Tax=Streptomyces sp. NPDC006658 TaxID=3156900 RepID=UPI0033C25CF9
MDILVPDDPVFFAKYQSIEEPLLRRLHRLSGARTDSHDTRVISDAYDSWVHVLVKLPAWPHWRDDDLSGSSKEGEPTGYILYDSHGRQLTSLYPLWMAEADLGRLAACYDLFVEAAKGRYTGSAPATFDPPEQACGFVDVFRRVMEVLLMPAPRGLMRLLQEVRPQGPVRMVTLTPVQEAEYQRFCEEIVTVLSAGDIFAYRSHRAMYL